MLGSRTSVDTPPLKGFPRRALIRDSWTRSTQLAVDPDTAPEPHALSSRDLATHRRKHPLAHTLPTIQALLVRHTAGCGLVVAVGDQTGRLLWIDGDRTTRRRAEKMGFVEGADWSEAAVGTSAPGTAVAVGRSIQVRGAEHFSKIVHPWSCSAVPVRDRATGLLLGVIDITGGVEAVAPATMPLLEATVAAVEAELHLRHLSRDLPHGTRPVGFAHPRAAVRGRAGAETVRSTTGRTSISVLQAPSSSSSRGGSSLATPAASGAATCPVQPPTLSVLGRAEAVLRSGSTSLTLSARHAEILTLLAWHPRGLSAENLATSVYGRPDAVVTIRAEIVRLRQALHHGAADLHLLSRPYRLSEPVRLDAHQVLAFLDRGAHRVALGGYVGELLPGSTAPGVVAVRTAVSSRLRESLMADAAVETLLAYARLDECAADVELWTQCLRLLPGRSPKRAGVVAHLESLEVATG